MKNITFNCRLSSDCLLEEKGSIRNRIDCKCIKYWMKIENIHFILICEKYGNCAKT